MARISDDPSARSIEAADLQAIFVPDRGMIGVSLRHRGEEILRRIEDLDAAAEKGSTAGIPLLYPWANRIASVRYSVTGREVSLVRSSPLLHFDERGLPIHGVPWSLLSWRVLDSKQDTLLARLDWDRSDLLSIFPFRHRIEIR